MSFFNDAQRDGLLTGRYICSECGGLMEFEDEWEDTLVCPACGHSVDLEHYGRLLHTLFYLCELADFEIEGRIILVDKRNGRVWR